MDNKYNKSESLSLLRSNSSYKNDDDDNNNNDGRYTSRFLERNFLYFSIAFSLNHGCVVSCLAYANSELGDLGSIGSGVLYICFAITAFLFSKPIVTMLGSKIALLLGTIGYCIYVFGFLVAVEFNVVAKSAAWLVYCVSAGIGIIIMIIMIIVVITIIIIRWYSRRFPMDCTGQILR